MDSRGIVNYKEKKNVVEFLEYKTKVVERFEGFVGALMRGGDESYKKAANLVLWLNKYLGYLCSEKKFNPTFNIRYERGQIVYVDFGYRIGNELGGAHYAMVLDHDNQKKAGSVTVVPLNSDKNKDTWYSEKYYVPLGKEIFDGISEKADEIQEQLREMLDELVKHGQFEEIEKSKLEAIRRKINIAQQIKIYAGKVDRKSVANCGQITTVSKMRIIHPTKKDDVLTGVVVHDNVMDAIENKIKKLYFEGLTKKK